MKVKWIPFLPAIVIFGDSAGYGNGSTGFEKLDRVVSHLGIDRDQLLGRSMVLGRAGATDPLCGSPLEETLAGLLRLIRFSEAKDDGLESVDSGLGRVSNHDLKLTVPLLALLFMESINPSAIVRGLLLDGSYTPRGDLIVAVLLNIPDLIGQVPQLAAHLANSFPSKRNTIQSSLLHIARSLRTREFAESLALALVSSRLFVPMCLTVASEFGPEDPCDVLNATFVGDSFTWLACDTMQASRFAPELHRRVMVIVGRLLEDVDRSQARLASCLRSLCGLVGVYGTTLNHDQVGLLVVAVRLGANSEILRMALCLVILGWASFQGPSLTDLGNRLLSTDHCPESLLVFIWLRIGQLDKIVIKMREILQMPLNIPMSRLESFRRVFFSLPVQMDLQGRILRTNARSLADSVELVYNLSQAPPDLVGAQEFGTEIHEWLHSVLSQALSPVHEHLPAAVQFCAQKAVASQSPLRFPEHEVQTLMRSSAEDYVPSKILLLLYLFTYKDELIYGDRAGSSGEDYPSSMWDMLPVRDLWLKSGQHSDAVIRGRVYPELTGLLVKLKPQLVEPQGLLRTYLDPWDLRSGETHKLSDTISGLALPGASGVGSVRGLCFVSPDQLEARISDVLPLLISILLKSSLVSNEDHRFAIYSRALPSRDSLLLDEVHALWETMRMRMGEEFMLMTINLMRKASSKPLELHGVVANPLFLFQVDDAVFRRAHFARIFLAILDAFKSASRQSYNGLFRFHARKMVRLFEDGFLRCAIWWLIRAHPAVHPCGGRAHLHVRKVAGPCYHSVSTTDVLTGWTRLRCVKRSLLKSDSLTTASLVIACADARAVVFAYIHQQLIEHADYIQLLLFEGYDRKLIEPTIEGIPSLRWFARWGSRAAII